MKNKFKDYNPEFTGIVEEFYENNQPKLNVGYKDGSIISEFNVIRNFGPHGRVCYNGSIYNYEFGNKEGEQIIETL